MKSGAADPMYGTCFDPRVEFGKSGRLQQPLHIMRVLPATSSRAWPAPPRPGFDTTSRSGLVPRAPGCVLGSAAGCSFCFKGVFSRTSCWSVRGWRIACILQELDVNSPFYLAHRSARRSVDASTSGRLLVKTPEIVRPASCPTCRLPASRGMLVLRRSASTSQQFGPFGWATWEARGIPFPKTSEVSDEEQKALAEECIRIGLLCFLTRRHDRSPWPGLCAEGRCIWALCATSRCLPRSISAACLAADAQYPTLCLPDRFRVGMVFWYGFQDLVQCL